MSDTLNHMTDDLTHESVPSLADFADEPSGTWPAGWYAAEVVEGYATAKGKVFQTEDTPSSKGDSRNARLCFKVTNGTQERFMQASFNYRSGDFSPKRLSFIKEIREEYKGVRGRWSDADAQRTSLALAKIGNIERALGFVLRNADGMVPTRAIGQKLDVRLKIDAESGFNEISNYDKAGSKARK